MRFHNGAPNLFLGLCLLPFRGRFRVLRCRRWQGSELSPAATVGTHVVIEFDDFRRNFQITHSIFRTKDASKTYQKNLSD